MEDRIAGHGPGGVPSRPDHHGEAALLLVESLIHGLVKRTNLSVDDAVDIVQTAIDVHVEVSEERGDDPSRQPTAQLLSSISHSLRIDQAGD